jgi:hypothetical protein
MAKTNIQELHDQDFNLWIEKIKQKIQNRNFVDMDWDNLLDEIDDMGKSEKRSLEFDIPDHVFIELEVIMQPNYFGEN